MAISESAVEHTRFAYRRPFAVAVVVFGLVVLALGAAGLVMLTGHPAAADQPARVSVPVPSGSVAPAPDPSPSAAAPAPVALTIPAIGVRSPLLRLGLNPNGTIAVPDLSTSADEAAWYKNSVTPGQIGTAVIEGHVDSEVGPAVFFRLGALHPGDHIDVTLADGMTAVFRVTGVREYLKSRFPAKVIYGATRYASLRLITCGGSFDYTSGHYLSSTVVYASLISSVPASGG